MSKKWTRLWCTLHYTDCNIKLMTLHYTTLHNSILRFTLHLTRLRYTTLHFTIHYTRNHIIHYTAPQLQLQLRRITLHCTNPQYAALRYIPLQCTPRHCTWLHYAHLQYTTLHYTTAHCNYNFKYTYNFTTQH